MTERNELFQNLVDKLREEAETPMQHAITGATVTEGKALSHLAEWIVNYEDRTGLHIADLEVAQKTFDFGHSKAFGFRGKRTYEKATLLAFMKAFYTVLDEAVDARKRAEEQAERATQHNRELIEEWTKFFCDLADVEAEERSIADPLLVSAAEYARLEAELQRYEELIGEV